MKFNVLQNIRRASRLIQLLQGVLHMSKHTSQEGTVQMGSQGISLLGQVLVQGRAFLNRAIHGDIVAGMSQPV